MKRRYGYATYIEWGFDCTTKKSYEKCIIAPARKIDLEHDGFNYTCKCGSEGAEFFISKTIEDAIQKGHFNPESIEFYRLNADEIKQKDLFLIKDLKLTVNHEHNAVITEYERYESLL